MKFSLLFYAFILSAIMHYCVQKIFIYYNRFDNINHRSSHKTLATRTGGIGVFLTLFLISLFYYFNQIELFDYKLFTPLGIMFIIGVYDDLYNANFKLKFLLQIIVAKILIDQGYVISNYHGLFGLNEVPWLLAQLSTIFVFMVVVNSINFIDGIDGLAITEVLKTIILIEYFNVNKSSIYFLGLLVIATILPLYFFNFKKNKKVFLGDGGSMLLGTLIMIYILIVLGPNYSLKSEFSINKLLFSVLIIFYPLFDLLRVFVIRILNGKSPFLPDQSHIHHLIFKRTGKMINVNLIILSLELIIIFLAYEIF